MNLGVTTIGGEYAFGECTNLETVTIPSTVKTIENDAFNRCWNITDVNYEGTEAEWSQISIGSGNNFLTGSTINYGSTATT